MPEQHVSDRLADAEKRDRIPRHTIEQQEASIYFRLVEDTAGAWVSYANHNVILSRVEDRLSEAAQKLSDQHQIALSYEAQVEQQAQQIGALRAEQARLREALMAIVTNWDTDFDIECIEAVDAARDILGLKLT